MPASEGTLTVDDVSAELGLPPDQRMIDCTDTARAWVESVKPYTPVEELWFAPDIHRGGVLYACGHYQSRVTPEGLAGYDPTIVGVDNSATLLWRARSLVRPDPVST